MKTFKWIFCVLILIIGVLGGIKHVSLFNSYGKNYTSEYTTYKQVCSIKELGELRSKLQELNLEYSIKNSSLTIKDNSIVIFEIKNDDTCYINDNTYIKSFQKMDTEDRSTIEIHGISENGKIKEKLTFEDKKNNIFFTKVGNEYFAKSITTSLLVIMICWSVSFISLVVLLVDIIIAFKNKKIKNDINISES